MSPLPPPAAAPTRRALAELNSGLLGESGNKLLATAVHVHVDVDGRDERLVAARAAVNILTRVFPRVTIAGNLPTILLPRSHPNQPVRLAQGEVPTLVVAVSPAPLEKLYPKARVLYVDNRGWTARLSVDGPWNAEGGPANRLGAYFAGCWAAADVFNYIFAGALPRAEPVTSSHTFSIMSFRENEAPEYEPDVSAQAIILDDVALVGAGSVGQACLEALAFVQRLYGDLHLIDHEDITVANMSRYPLAFGHNVGAPKVEVGKEHLQNLHPSLRVNASVPVPSFVGLRMRMAVHDELQQSAIEAQIRPFSLGDYRLIMSLRRRPYPLVAVAVDSEAVRRDIQMGLHRVVLNAWTLTEDGQMAFSIGRHRITGERACMACIYHSQDPHEPTEVDFAMRLTKWPREKVVERLIDRPDLATAEEEVRQVAERRGISEERWRQVVGRPLREVIHHACGLASFSQGDRNVVAPVAHVTAMAGALLAAAIVREATSRNPHPDNLAIFDALRLPTRLAIEARPKAKGCLCADPDVQNVYRAEWNESK